MADAVFIIHDKVAINQARIFCEVLNSSGIFAITYEMAVGNSSHSEIQENWFTLIEYIPIFIILAGPALFTDPYLSEIAHDAIAAKKAICVLYGFCDRLPTWFSSRSISIGWGDYRGWNKLIEALSKYVPILPDTRPT